MKRNGQRSKVSWLAVGLMVAGLVPLSSFAAKDVAHLSPQQSLAKITVPDGFKVALFAGEPDVVQPIAMTLDDRGRLWVVENLSYPTWKETGRDRIVIFEDKDNDGQFDTKKIFWDKGRFLTGITLGFGGVYICNAPDLAFIPDKNGDDIPDAEPTVLVDGWSTKGKHNVLNALKWGPDGWLYGCNGITAPSKVGKPGTADKDRINISCGVWRYHPTKHKFEVVAHGTTNPWGLDWDQYGQMFVTNCVIKHIFHIVPGGHYERMFGEDFNKYTYGLIQSPADHIHWAEGTKWTDSRGGKGAHDAAGGGHAHAGLMIYQGDNWPAEYRHNAFIPNVHGGRVNRDTLHAKDSGYTIKHNKDFLFANDDWFRGLEMITGPDGGVYMSDWHDTGECHDYDKAETSTGRIYKITYVGGGAQPKPKVADLSKLSSLDLIDFATSDNVWYSRRAIRLLQERHAQEDDLSGTLEKIESLLFGTEPRSTAVTLNGLWMLHASHVVCGNNGSRLKAHPDAAVRAWTLRLQLEDCLVTDQFIKKLVEIAKNDPSPIVRLEIASLLQRISLSDRWAIAEALASHAEDVNDARIPLMIWYGIEPAVALDKDRALKLATTTKIPLLRQYIARRIAAK